MPAPRLLALAGSARRDSLNRRLLQVAVAGARAAGAEVTVLELGELALPLYDGDLEAAQGIPANAKALKRALREHGGLLLACPEYNSSITPLLKNAIDWASRAEPGEGPLACFEGKVAALMSASPGALGGLRGLAVVRALLGNIRVLVLPEQVAVAKAGEAFTADGGLADQRQDGQVRALGARLAAVVARLG
jgi:chromate reductase